MKKTSGQTTLTKSGKWSTGGSSKSGQDKIKPNTFTTSAETIQGSGVRSKTSKKGSGILSKRTKEVNTRATSNINKDKERLNKEKKTPNSDLENEGDGGSGEERDIDSDSRGDKNKERERESARWEDRKGTATVTVKGKATERAERIVEDTVEENVNPRRAKTTTTPKAPIQTSYAKKITQYSLKPTAHWLYHSPMYLVMHR